MINDEKEKERIFNNMRNYVNVDGNDKDISQIYFSPWVLKGIVVQFKDGSVLHYNELTSSFRGFSTYDEMVEYYQKFPDDEEEFRVRFSKRMYEYLAASHMTQEDLSYESEISNATISRYLSGDVLPSAYAVLKICKVFGCKPNDLMGFGL